LLLVGGHLVWRFTYYGVWMANPSYVKTGHGLAGVPRGLTYLFTGLSREMLILLIVPAVFAVVAARPGRNRTPGGGRLPAQWTLAAVVAGYLCFIVLMGGDSLYRVRFLAHLAPLLALLAIDGLRQGRISGAAGRWGMLAATCAVAAGLVLPLASDTFSSGGSLSTIRMVEGRWEELGRSLEARSPAELLLATNVAGKLPYFARRRTLDMYGLNDAHIARAEAVGLGTGIPAHERADPQYVLRREPDLIFAAVLDMLSPQEFTNPRRVAELMESSGMSLYTSLVRSPEFLRAYRPGYVAGAPKTWFNVFVRRGGAGERIDAEFIRILDWNPSLGPR
jgi:hypothetical protein